MRGLQIAVVALMALVVTACSSARDPNEVDPDGGIRIEPPALSTESCTCLPDTCSHCETCTNGTGTRPCTCSPAPPCADGFRCDIFLGCNLSKCTGDGDCDFGYYCATSGDAFCTPKKLPGVACGNPRECGTGNCVNGVCCNVSSCPGGSCNNPGHAGTCTKPNGVSCSGNAECINAHCVDNVCCDTACTGQCEACNVSAGTLGTCSPVAGPPTGGRAPCTGTGAGTVCGQACNGSDRSACHYPAAGTPSCGAESCTALNWKHVGTCDGAGTCNQLTTSCGAYQCNPAATHCNPSCSTSADCVSPSTCLGSVCGTAGGLGSPCSSGPACASGNCVDSVCCSASSCTGGSKCNLPGKAGYCSKSNGTACGAPVECASGNCTDGVCCDKGCGNQCESCALPGKSGTCSTVLGAPAGGRPACTGVGLGTACGPSCNGSDPTKCNYPSTSTACGANSCATGTETRVGTCDGSGSCTSTTRGCSPYTCGPTSCKASCTTTGDCASGYACIAGSCGVPGAAGAGCSASLPCASGLSCVDGVCCTSSTCPAGSKCNVTGFAGSCIKVNGTACSANAECSSNHCVDGVCCDSACADQCQSCGLTGKTGTCSPVTGAPVGGRPACTGVGVGSACGSTCNGTDTSKCNYPGSSSICGSNSCSGGTETHIGNCDGSGSCGSTTRSCGAYLCDASSCKTSCTSNADCGSAFACIGGSCGTPGGLGIGCSASSPCGSGLTCVDDVCCSSPTCGAGSACNLPGSKGTCSKKNGSPCASGGECGSGFCVDNVCCDDSCTGECQACDAPGKLGTCTAVSGKPHGGRKACDDGAGDVCKAMTCDGVDPSKCAAFASASTSCGSEACATDTHTAASSCDGSGSCKKGASNACAPYVCDPGAQVCRIACTTNDQCATGYECRSSACVPTGGAKCADDVTSVGKDGVSKPCSPYKCGPDGNCIPTCGTSNDCVPGSACDSSGHCVPQGGGDTGSSGGCSMGGGGGAQGVLFGMAMAALGLTRRRRANAPTHG